MVLTHGLRWRPFSTAFLASSAAPIITDGLEVLVQDVIAAITTAPWSSSNSVPSMVTVAGFDGRPGAVAPAAQVVGRRRGAVAVTRGRRVGGREGLRDGLVVPVLVTGSST